MSLLTARPIEATFIHDPAIDTARMSVDELRRYEVERDETLLKFKPGMQPARWTLRRLSKAQQLAIAKSAESESDVNTRAFCVAFVSVKGLTTEDGSTVNYSPADPDRGLTPDEITNGPICIPHILDLGAVAWGKSFLAPGSVPRCVLHRSLRERWEALPCLSVEPSAARQSKSKGNEMQASTVPAEASNAARSGSPTDAHATAETSPPAG